MYEFLVGQPPFAAEVRTSCHTPSFFHTLCTPSFTFCLCLLLLQGDISNTYDRIEALKYDIPDFVSPQAQDLIRSMLQADATKRPSLETCLKHPWIERYSPAPKPALSVSTAAPSGSKSRAGHPSRTPRHRTPKAAAPAAAAAATASAGAVLADNAVPGSRKSKTPKAAAASAGAGAGSGSGVGTGVTPAASITAGKENAAH